MYKHAHIHTYTSYTYASIISACHPPPSATASSASSLSCRTARQMCCGSMRPLLLSRAASPASWSTRDATNVKAVSAMGGQCR